MHVLSCMHVGKNGNNLHKNQKGSTIPKEFQL